MKELLAFILTLVLILGLAACAAEREQAAENTDIPMQETIDTSEIPGATRFIVEIRDRAAEENLPCAEEEELFYEDETTQYYFNVIKSHYIMVIYNNSGSEDIITALKAGRATIEDLDEFGIEYHTAAKK